jgi:hypothetical protein
LFYIVIHFNINLASNPYGIPPQFGYYAPPRQPLPPNAAALSHPGISHHPENVHHGPPPAGRGDDQEHPQQAPSEFGGLVSYFSSQQELD